MADDVTPRDIRARQFDVSRRGYDREQVEQYLSALADEIESLTSKVEGRKAGELKVGLDDPEALALELGNIGSEVASILEAARTAADGMRGRASADVESWRSTAETETRALTAEASEQSQSMRAAAWNEGSSMLASSLAEAKALVDHAKEEALFIRAEAEREAIRLTGDAKRDREESIRSARMEADQLLETARNESDGIMMAANQQAELAQERARALEDRRSELLAELESTRDSISHLEEEIESKRSELESPPPVAEPLPGGRTHHETDGGSVRIVAPSKSLNLRPVDAEDLVADVVALRSEVEAAESSAPKIQTETIIAPPEAAPAAESADEASIPEIPVRDVEEKPETAHGTAPEPAAGPDEIGSLFASLRAVPEPESESEPEPEPEQEREPEAQSKEPAGETKEAVELPETIAGAEPEPYATETSDAFLIPLQNAALKEIKRSLVDLQNDALEHLRTDDGWEPKKSFTNRFKKPFAELAEAVTGNPDDGGAGKAFATDLHAAVIGAVGKARSSDAGDREVASMVSRVFRMWRADESERRVVDAARSLQSDT